MIHRFYGAIDEKLFDNLLGVDAGANTALGLGFRLRDNWDLAILRSSLNKAYFISSKYMFSDGLSLLLGLTDKVFSPAFQDDKNLVGQMIFSRELIKDRFYLSLAPTYATAKLYEPTFAVGTALALQFNPNGELLFEYVPVFSGHALKYPTLAGGLKLKTFGHFFTLLVSNTFQTQPNGYIIGSGDNVFRFGFNITRKF